MSILFKNINQLLSESCEAEICDFDDFENSLLDEIEELESLEDDICYTAEMVNVICQECTYGSRYLIEYDNLYKLMESYNVDAVAAMKMVCEHNLISLADTYLVVESSEMARNLINEAKCCKSGLEKAKKHKEISKCCNELKNLKNKGIKLLAKKKK